MFVNMTNLYTRMLDCLCVFINLGVQIRLGDDHLDDQKV